MANVTHQQALNIAMEHHQAGRLSDAEAIYRQLLAIYPQNPDLWHLLGVLAHHMGRSSEALELIQRAIAANPTAFEYHNNLGLLLTDLRQFDQAVFAFQTAIRLSPERAEARYNSGITLGKMGRLADSIAAYRAALALSPDHAKAKLNLGIALAADGRVEEALAHYRDALKSNPNDTEIENNLGNVLKDLARSEEAAECYLSALAKSPNDAAVRSNLGIVQKDSGDIDAALDSFRRSLALDPSRPEIHSNVIFTLYSDPKASIETIAGEHRQWHQRHAASLKNEWLPHANDCAPGRRLRIGYVSADLRDHVVGKTLLPCFEAHDRTQFDLICYSETAAKDSIGESFCRGSAVWREIAGIKDQQLAAQIRDDRIDILVDLSLHTAYNRLLAFARKPAPVQVAWLGYPGATGLDAMDYWIADPYLAPPGLEDADGFEKPVRLPDCWCCYGAPADSPDPGDLPARQAGSVTFGSFNNFAKTNERVLSLWAEILRTVEDSRLLLLSKAANPDRTLRFFERSGVAPERVSFLQYYPAIAGRTGQIQPLEYLYRYRQIDIALDPFPYNGMTTTCDALWMGVPVVALIGGTPISRASFSLLSNVGLPELAAHTEHDYASIATDLARNLPRLAELRTTLRDRMKASPLLDAPRFARNLEAAYRMIWQRWCDGKRHEALIHS